METPAVPPAALAAPVAGVPSHLRQIGWTPGHGPRRPLVAVLDTGVDVGVPGLGDAVVAGGARSFAPGRPDPLTDPSGHGTHVAGIIADIAAGDRGPGVRILPVAIAGPDGSTRTLDLVRGVRYATARGARVINISFGGEGFSAAEQNAIDAASRAGALVVVSAGNNGTQGGPPVYPGAYRQAMAVGAVGADGRPLLISAKGPHLAVVAPGERVVAARAHGGGLRTEARTGTSMAAAVVSGVAVRILARRPGLTGAQLRSAIENTARDVPPRGRDVGSGLGLVDLPAAVRFPAPREDAEPNDDTGLIRALAPLMGPGGARGRVVRGRTGSWGDPRDGFRVHLRAGQSVTAALTAPADADLDLAVWRAGTPRGERDGAFARRWLAGIAIGPDSDERLSITASRTGYYTVEVQGGRAPAYYRLIVRRARGL